jgi:multidrug resistance efflux pump
MNKIFLIGITLFLLVLSINTKAEISVIGELEALKTEGYSPPRIKGIWQYTISYMADDGTIVKPGMPVLMFKTDEIQTNLVSSQGNLAIKLSELKNKEVSNVEIFEKKALSIEEKRMELDKASRIAELPKSLLAKNDYLENQLKFKLAKQEFDAAQLDLDLSKQKALTEKSILEAEVNKLKIEIKEYTDSISSMKMSAVSEGIVMHKSGWDKNKFAIGDTVWGGNRVIEIANLSQIIAKLEISENNIKFIEVGQKIKITLDSLPDKEFIGTIQSLAKVVKIKSKNQPSKILEATAFIENVDVELMRPGMRLKAEIVTDNAISNASTISTGTSL